MKFKNPVNPGFYEIDFEAGEHYGAMITWQKVGDEVICRLEVGDSGKKVINNVRASQLHKLLYVMHGEGEFESEEVKEAYKKAWVAYATGEGEQSSMRPPKKLTMFGRLRSLFKVVLS